MLVLSRKKGQELIIGDNIRIYVSRVAGNRVTLGIDAPSGVSVMRAELAELVDAFNEHQQPDEQPAAAVPR
jgi:carbon storage regulator